MNSNVDKNGLLYANSPQPWNSSSFANLDDITLDSSLAWLLCALLSAMILVIYITYYNSRVVGYVLTKFINSFFIGKYGYFKIGSFSVSVLSGKVMYRDVAYITPDYSVRIQDGWLIFRWWRTYVKRDISEDLSHSDTRLSLLLNGLEVHFYNRSSVYARLEQLFGLEQQIFPPDNETERNTYEGTLKGPTAASRKGVLWRDLIPVIKVDISCGRLVFGNRLLPNTLLLNVEEAHIVYTTKPASSRLDPFMHVTKCKAENFKVILAPSPKYTGLVDEPPRFMGEGFVVSQANRVDLYYYMDEPGIEPEEPELVQLANGDIIPQRTSPAWGLEVKCGKGTDFSYGPWADRQREELYKFFFPQDYQEMQVTQMAKPGELRQATAFDIRLSTLADATIDILFSKNKETNAIHMNVGPGSYLEVTIPWVMTEQGFTSRINGQLLHVDATTSLQYRSLLANETIEFDIKVNYPLRWNAHQDWMCNLTGCKATVFFIYEHKNYFQDLMNDWASKSPPDLLKFVPYTWHFNILLKEFEIIVLANEYNWVDCSSHNPENSHLALCGEVFDLSFDLQFVDFLPKTVPFKFWIQGESVDLALFLPEVNTSQKMFLALSNNTKFINRDGTTNQKTGTDKKWRNVACKDNNWIDCWTVPIVALSIGYTYHPVPPVKHLSHDLNFTTPEKEEILLLPIRPPVGEESGRRKDVKKVPENFDPTTLDADKINLELEIGPSVLFLYGSVLKSLVHIKENYLGEDLKFVDFDTSSKTTTPSKHNETFDDNEVVVAKDFDSRVYRPLDITVSITMHDIQGHLVLNCSENDPPCPSLYLERFGFEMHKTYQETMMQMLLSPLILSVTDKYERNNSHNHLKNGHIALSGLQVRGHAMFSNEGRSLDDETLEYGWLIEVQIGDITGRITTPQVYQIILGIETFIFLAEDVENSLQHPIPYKFCQHQLPQTQCAESTDELFCPTVDEIKYRMIRLAVDAVDLHLVEVGTACNIQLYPLRLSTCNLHGNDTRAGITLLIQNINLKQYITTNVQLNQTGNINSHSLNQPQQRDHWLEVGGCTLGPVTIESVQAQIHPEMHIIQDEFLKLHDKKTKCLWFLWPSDLNLSPPQLRGKCGCVGGCRFLRNNRNGQNFFHPTATDEANGINSALFRIFNSDLVDPGYGQSILHESQLVFGLPGIENDGSNSTEGHFHRYYSHVGRPSPSSILLDGCSQRHASDSCDTLLTDRELASSNENIKNAASRQNSYDTTTSSMVSIQDNNKINSLSESTSGPNTTFRESSVASNTLSSSNNTTEEASRTQDTTLMPVSSSVGSFLEDHRPGRKDSLVSESKLSIDCPSPNMSNQFQTSVPSLVSLPTNGNVCLESRNSLNGHQSLVISKSSSRQSLGNGTWRSANFARSPDAVRRALSTGSDSAQSSEIFFSAEELGHLTPEDRLGLPHHATADHYYTIRRGTHEGKRSLQDIQEQSLQDSNPTLLHTAPEIGKDFRDGDTHSVSSTSFISALSSQEDLAMVDLHMQLNRPITESPLLMSCYNCHMTKVYCNHWYEPPPLPHVIPQQNNPNTQRDVPFTYFRTRWVPRFHRVSEGFTSIRLVDKNVNTCKSSPPPAPSTKHPQTDVWDFSTSGNHCQNRVHKETSAPDERVWSGNSNMSKTTMMIKLKGDVDVFISPLMLEATQRFIEVITPTLSNLHPLSIVNHIHYQCSNKVQAMNHLKKEKYMQVAQLREAKKSTSTSKRLSGQVSPSSSTYEEMQLSQMQAFVHVKKINICVLQASIVEEVISFSALDNIHDLTCVSLLAVCFENLSGQLYLSSQAKKVIQTFSDDSPDSSLRVKTKETNLKKSKNDWFSTEPITIETSQVQQEEQVLSFDVNKVHMQLRRLKNSSSVLKEALLTVISKQHSKVFFTFEKLMSPLPLSNSSVERDRVDAFGLHDPNDDERMGFNMFECGLEDFGIKMVKRVGFGSNQTRERDSVETLTSSPLMSAEGEGDANVRREKEPEPHNDCEECRAGGDDVKPTTHAKRMKEDTSSCMIELKMIWFNFAAPPHTPNTRKIDFTRLDWHLLSTATPAINSWMNPSDRLFVSVKKLSRETEHRQNAVMACLMTEALDVQGIHMPVKDKYHKMTPLAKTIREDPSCQLLLVLQRYLSMASLSTIEENTRGDLVPPLIVLRKGLLSVSRQWKNVLYMPILVEQKYKLRKHIRPLVSFALPLVESIQNINEDLDLSLDDCEVTDEKTLLLKAEGGSLGGLAQSSNVGLPPSECSRDSDSESDTQPDVTEGAMSSGSASAMQRKRLPSYVPRSSRASIAFPVPMPANMFESPGRLGVTVGGTQYFGSAFPRVGLSKLLSQQQIHAKAKHNESNYSLHSEARSISSVDPNLPSSSLGTPQRCPPENQQEDEDLYNWMVRQQDYMHGNVNETEKMAAFSVGLESNMNTLTTEHSGDDEPIQNCPSPTLNVAPLTAQLADAHVIFHPLLSVLGVHSQIPGTSIGKKFGPNISVYGYLEIMKIDIVESDFSHKNRRRNFKLSQERSGKFFIDTHQETPAFVCERLITEVELREVKDLERARIEEAVESMDKKSSQHTIIFSSGNGLKKHTTTVVHFSLNVAYISQQVNMPLIRLLHQFFSMYQNAKETQMELKENRPSFHKENFMGHKKQDSSSGSESQPDPSKGLYPPVMAEATPVNPKDTVVNIKPPVVNGTTSAATTVASRRPQSLTQRLRVSSKGYTNLNERASSPLSLNLSESVGVDVTDLSVASEKTLVEQLKENMPKCWRNMYYLLDLYGTMPETKTISNRVPVVPADVSEGYKGNGKYEPLKEHKIDIEESSKDAVDGEQMSGKKTQSSLSASSKLTVFKRSVVVRDRVPVVVFGVVKIHRTRLLATLSGLKLESELAHLHSSVSYKERSRGTTKKWTESSVTGHLGHSRIILLEGIPPNLHRTIDDLDGAATRSPKLFREASIDQQNEPQLKQRLLKPIVVQFSIILDSLAIGAALLPSLQAQYRMDQITSSGVTGSKAKFVVNLPKHTLSFATKVQTSEANLPSSASIDLPPVHLSAEYIQSSHNPKQETWDANFADGVVLRQGGYLSAVAEIGAFEHSLTTDLLNHLVFVQKVFMKEVNEVVQKMSGADKPVPLWGDETKAPSTYQLLYTLELRLKGIQITATTPTNSALRLETGALELQLSNRVQNMGAGRKKNNLATAKLFGKAHVDVNLSLGQLLKNALFEEAEPEFQQFAYFKTRIALRNALQDEMITTQNYDKEAVLITLNRPLIYIQPVALDKAVIVWLNYKNAYEYWNEQRASLNKEARETQKERVLTATQQVFEKVPPISQLSSQSLGTLFLQLTIDDMGICLPLSPDTGLNLSRQTYDTDPRGACVVTLESTRISACSSGSLVSKGKFSGLCIRFADDFETSLDDWKPDPNDSNIMNLCIVSEGTYEVCSRTVVNQKPENAKWILNVQWQMEGVDIHIDNSIGKELSSLATTLTSLTGTEEDREVVEMEYDIGDQTDGQSVVSQDSVILRKPNQVLEGVPGFPFDNDMDAKKRSRLIEKEMNEQAKTVNDLRTLGASQSTIEQEIRRLHELEAAVFNDFRRDVIKKLRRQSVRDKLGLGSKSSSHMRSKSIVIPHSPSTDDNFSNIPSPLGTSLSPSSMDSSPTHGHTRTISFDATNLTRASFNEKEVKKHTPVSLVNSGLSVRDGSFLLDDIPFSNVLASGPHVKRAASFPTGAEPASSNSNDSSPNTNTTQSELATDSDFDVFSPLRVRDDMRDQLSALQQIRMPESIVPTVVQDRKPVSAQPSVTPGKQSILSEPNIDFELDVKVLINSGKCVLHSKDPARDEERNKSFRKERSFSNSTFEFPTSPGNRKKSNNARPATSATKTKYLSAPVQMADFTVFLIPGLDVKVHYNSKTICTDSPGTAIQGDVTSQDLNKLTEIQALTGQKKLGMKKASLFAWITLQGIPEECVITPQILDFLEQTLEPIPILPLKTNPLQTETVFGQDAASAASTFTTPATYAYASFPVDVTVYFRMQPSALRFSCLPVSRVECLLCLPSLDLVFSSKRAEDENLTSEFGSSLPVPKQKGAGDGGDSNRRDSLNQQHPFSTLADPSQAAVGGLSVTGCLEDFSLYIFHPYGGKKVGISVTPKDLSSESSPLNDTERKDSLSLQVEFVKVNISRSRKTNVSIEGSTPNQPKVSSRFPDQKSAIIRFSAICDIGSASFKYDMRRLTEILAFPKAWYRRSIVRRLFLGDQSSAAVYSDQESMENSNTPNSPLMADSMGTKAEVFNFSPINRSATSNDESLPISPSLISRHSIGDQETRDKLHLNLESGSKLRRRGFASPETPRSSQHKRRDEQSITASSTPFHLGKSSSSWETLVLFAVNLSKLNVHMNMGNVMGNTMWTTRDTILQGRLSIGSSGHKNMIVSMGLGGSSLDAKGGIVGGTIELSQIDAYVHIKEDPGMEPDHTFGMKLFALEARLDYMGTSMLMGRVSSLDVTLRDEWRVNVDQTLDPGMHPTKRPALIFIHGDLSWDQLQLIISKSTTADLLKMFTKLEEFFTQQFKSSKRVFSSLQPRAPRHGGRRGHFNTRTTKKKTNEGIKLKEIEARHHRHWQKVLTKVSGMQLATLPCPLPRHGTILGGTMELHGNHISLACFHDINFRAKHWALFSLKEPSISFATEAQSVIGSSVIDTHIVQNLSVSLGHNVTEHTQHHNMATVCRISRNFLFPPQFRTMKEWFHYAFFVSELDEVDRFPSLERDRSDSVTMERQHQRSSSKGQDFNHAMEMIFSLPTLQFHLKTEHMQPELTPDHSNEIKPKVECTFVTEFEDHIFVTVDAEAFFFLHDLITAYIKEKDRTVERAMAQTPDGDGERKRNKVADSFQKDWRNYECKTWHLEPTVRLLSWAGKGIEPYGVDYILHKLGFSHARITIPKWLQRGTMDPLDKILSVLMGKMVDVVREEKSAQAPYTR
uniref:Bridge-like lipid transfer protein family member 1 C-terminal domain-containing protein n=1 Tax=Strigamia maritima TaxID=126957 RepID=T1J6C2_STRMM